MPESLSLRFFVMFMETGRQGLSAQGFPNSVMAQCWEGVGEDPNLWVVDFVFKVRIPKLIYDRNGDGIFHSFWIRWTVK